MKQRNIFWGSLLVLFGSLLLIHKLNLIHLNWWAIRNLWPFLLMFWGLTLLPVKPAIKIGATFILIVLSIFTYSHFDASNYKSRHWFGIEKRSQSYDDSLVRYFSEAFHPDIERGTLKLAAGAGSFNLVGISSDLVHAEEQSGSAKFEYKVEDSGTEARILIQQPTPIRKIRSEKINRLSLMLHPDPVWSFDLAVGAAELDFDMREFKIENLNIDCGAASIYLRLGELYDETHIVINSGASSIELNIPIGAGCRIEGASVLSNRNLPGFTKMGSNAYETDQFDSQQQKIYVRMDSAVSNFTVIRE